MNIKIENPWTPLEEFRNDFVDITYKNAQFLILEDLQDWKLGPTLL